MRDALAIRLSFVQRRAVDDEDTIDAPENSDGRLRDGEAIPLADESQDAVTSAFMFHELPPKVRRIVFAELARVLKRGGRLVLLDSLQIGDKPDYDGMLELFPQSYHEPYFASYLKEDFGAMASACGLTHVRDLNTFVSKVMIFDKP
jgi:ubiquinone/menaquinone biosynthesis C-methylase UbiE